MADNILRSYGDQAKKEDVVLNAIEILTAEESRITNMLGKTEAIDTTHHFLTDELKAAGDNSHPEGDDYAYEVRTTPERNSNIIQHIQIPFRVSDTQQHIEHYHGRNELERQTSKALREFSNDMEHEVLRQTLTSGASGTAPKMSGIIEAISTADNTQSFTSGTAWSASILDGIVKDNWENSNGDLATDVFMGPYLRKETDGFTQKTNTVVNNPGGMTNIMRTVSTYTTAFSTVNLHTHRYIQKASDATGRVLGLRPEKLKIAFLKRPYVDTQIARTGTATPRSINASLTLEVRNQDSNFFADGFFVG